MLPLIHWIAVRIGRSVARLLLYPIAFYFLLSAHAARRVSYHYLERVRGRPPHWWHLFCHFYCFAATILDRVYLLRGEFHYFEVTLHQKEILHRRVESGKGCILLGSHLGSFEVLRTSGGKTTHCQFLGTPATFPAGPILLAAVMHCPIILFFGLYRGGNRYEIHFEELFEEVTLNRDRRAEEIQSWTQRYVDRLEHYT